jgi:hypothetical protein
MPTIHAPKRRSNRPAGEVPRAVRQAPDDDGGREPRQRLGPRALLRGFKWLTQLGWPKSFPIVQFPNAPLIIAFLAGQAATHTHGTTHAYAAAISYLAMIIWAYEELVHGVNWFRHLLGLGYAISTIVHLALTLQR